MLTPEQIKDALSDRNIMEVARRTGLDKNTVYAYARGDVKDPTYNTMRVLSDYLTASVPE